MAETERELPPLDRGLSAQEVIEIERARAWAYFINGGGGSPEYFDRPAWLRMQERSR